MPAQGETEVGVAGAAAYLDSCFRVGGERQVVY